jgi:ferredoxin-NADP reductase
MSQGFLQDYAQESRAPGLNGTVAVIENAVASPRARLLRLAVGAHAVDFAAGHAVLVGLHGARRRQPYSIASSPEQVAETGCLELLVGGSDDASDAVPALFHAPPGTLLDLAGPIGSFVCPPLPPDAQCIFAAGGVGVAPVRAIVDHLLRRPWSPPIAVLQSARVPGELAFADEFGRHARAGRLVLRHTITRGSGASWDGPRGRIGRPHFEAIIRDPAVAFCFVCGPLGLVRDSVAALSVLGVPHDQIRIGHC